MSQSAVRGMARGKSREAGASGSSYGVLGAAFVPPPARSVKRTSVIFEKKGGGNNEKAYEMDRSIHPIVLKALVRRFSDKA